MSCTVCMNMSRVPHLQLRDGLAVVALDSLQLIAANQKLHVDHFFQCCFFCCDCDQTNLNRTKKDD